MFVRFLINATLIYIATFTVSCGDYKNVHYKNYVLYINAGDKDLLNQSTELIKEFNYNVGAEVLRVSANRKSSNSTISFISGLRESKSKLGYGQWETYTQEEPPYHLIQGRRLKREIIYAMNLEFDTGFFKERVGLPLRDSKRRELFLLFCHEVGHGLLMDHVDDDTAVMHHVITGIDKKNFESFFKEVRTFFDL